MEVYETQKQLLETQADSSVSINPDVRTPFTWYSPTKGVGKIDQYDIGRIIRLCKHMDNLLSIKDKLLPLVQNVRRNRPCDLIKLADVLIFRRIRKICEVHKTNVIFNSRI